MRNLFILALISTYMSVGAQQKPDFSLISTDSSVVLTLILYQPDQPTDYTAEIEFTRTSFEVPEISSGIYDITSNTLLFSGQFDLKFDTVPSGNWSVRLKAIYPSDTLYSDTLTFIVPPKTVGIASTDKGEITVYPNPIRQNSEFSVTGLENERMVTFEMYDSSGRMILKASRLPDNAPASFKLHDIPAGVYHYVIGTLSQDSVKTGVLAVTSQ